MSDPARAFTEPRPASVTVVLAFGWLSVAIDLVAAVSLLIMRGDSERLASLGIEASSALSLAVGSLITGLVLGIVLLRLGRGGSVARLLVTVVLLARVAVNVWAMIAVGANDFGSSFLSVAVALVALLFLWNRAASRFFATNG